MTSPDSTQSLRSPKAQLKATNNIPIAEKMAITSSTSPVCNLSKLPVTLLSLIAL